MARKVHRIFICYRRDGTGNAAGRLAEWLRRIKGVEVLIDVAEVRVGDDFHDRLDSVIAACDIMLVVIGPRWLTADEQGGKRRLFNENDPVANEISVALREKLRIIPVLVDGARMPDPTQLPPHLLDLVKSSGVRVSHETFRADIDVLTESIKKLPPGSLTKLRRRPYLRILLLILLGCWVGWFTGGILEASLHNAIHGNISSLAGTYLLFCIIPTITLVYFVRRAIFRRAQSSGKLSHVTELRWLYLWLGVVSFSVALVSFGLTWNMTFSGWVNLFP